MSNKVITVAILGAGSRGADAYGSRINKQKDKFKIVAICDLRKERLDRFSKIFGVDSCMLFTDEKEFFKKRLADMLIIGTPDKEHFRHAVTAMELGYDLLLEKPLTDKKDECDKLLEVQKKHGNKVLVCHVLRYGPPFYKLFEIVESGKIGTLIGINAIEGVRYWHQAHSYVRGNWRNSQTSTPMILAKCCHDLDLIQYYANSKCKSVCSTGELKFFKKENAPENSADRCVNCKYIDECPYSAKQIYIDRWKLLGCPEDLWPFNVIAAAPLTEEKLQEAITNGDYGRCVFKCDNNVVDNQIVMMEFENGVRAELTMTAFAAGRRYHLYGTKGDVILDENNITLNIFSIKDEPQVFPLKDLIEEGHSHGGGDQALIGTLYDLLLGNAPARTDLSNSIESHLMGIAAEKSRLLGGKLVKVHE